MAATTSSSPGRPTASAPTGWSISDILTFAYLAYFTVIARCRFLLLSTLNALLPSSLYRLIFPTRFPVLLEEEKIGKKNLWWFHTAVDMGRYGVGRGQNPVYVLVTGASSGIGLDAALSLCQTGYHVLATVRRDEDRERLLQLAREKDVEDLMLPVRMDVREHSSVIQVLEDLQERLSHGGCIAAIVCNAGICSSLPFELTDMEDIRNMMNVNVLGVCDIIQTFLPLLRQFKGRVVVVGSVNGSVGIPCMGAYCMSKFALEGLVDTLRVEVEPAGVAVSLVKPGSIKTPIFLKVYGSAEKELEEAESSRVHQYDNLIYHAKSLIPSLHSRGTYTAATSAAILDSIQNPFPQPRYLVGLDAVMGVTLRQWIPDFLWDHFLMFGFRFHALFASNSVLKSFRSESKKLV